MKNLFTINLQRLINLIFKWIFRSIRVVDSYTIAYSRLETNIVSDNSHSSFLCFEMLTVRLYVFLSEYFGVTYIFWLLFEKSAEMLIIFSYKLENFGLFMLSSLLYINCKFLLEDLFLTVIFLVLAKHYFSLVALANLGNSPFRNIAL